MNGLSERRFVLIDFTHGNKTGRTWKRLDILTICAESPPPIPFRYCAVAACWKLGMANLRNDKPGWKPPEATESLRWVWSIVLDARIPKVTTNYLPLLIPIILFLV